MRLKSLKDTDVRGKTILYRSPYDIGVKEKNGQVEITDDSRIRATLPTLKYLLKQDCKIVVLTYVKRPDGKVVENLRTTPHAQVLSRLLNHPVGKIDDCVGLKVRDAIAEMKSGQILMLENTRFHSKEMIDDDSFAQELAKNGELVVFDGFPQAHRIHASTTGILRHLSGCAGFYLEKEVKALTSLMKNPKKPFTLVIGGAKISDKVDAINNLFDLADIILVGGGVANVFLKAEGKKMGDSFVEDVFVDKVKKEKKDWVVYAKEILAKDLKNKIRTPVDLVIGDSLELSENTREVVVGQKPDLVPSGWVALDIGPQTQKLFTEIISQSRTVFWNGPMGKFEDKRFSAGSRAVAEAVGANRGTTVIAGGDTIGVAKKYADLDSFSHVSLAGGATLEFLAGKKLPVLEMLMT